MHDSLDISQEVAARELWLLLIHHIPPKPDYFRVKVRRRLQQIGAVALKNTVYVLPLTDEALEDFQWLGRMVSDEGGEATVCTASFIDGLSDGEVRSMFLAQSEAEYDAVMEAAGEMDDPSAADIERLEHRLAQAVHRDHFHAARADEARRVVQQLTERARDTAVSADKSTKPQGATWVTRSGVYIDRIASAWLIRRFIDEDGRFKYVSAGGYTPAPGELRFDMFEGEFTHEGEDCTFEGLCRRFVPGNPALRAIGQIVHDIDCKDAKFGREETEGVATLIRGIASANSQDSARIDAGAVVFDGLYAAFQGGHV
jgi:hypothetical protein